MTEVLVRFGFGDDHRIERAIAQVLGGVRTGASGSGWMCASDARSLPFLGARASICPLIDLEALRLLSLLAPDRRGRQADQVAAAPLNIWRRRVEERPHGFGHGYQFKTVRWPSLWYDALAVVDAVGRFPQTWSGPDARDEDVTALCEIAACLLAYNVGVDARVTPLRVHEGYEEFSFGRKDASSPFATAVMLGTLARLAPLAEQIAEIDARALPSSRGTDVVSRPPESPAPSPGACAVPTLRAYEHKHVLPRLLTRHHLDIPWDFASIESTTSDIVALYAGAPSAPYLSLAARSPAFDPHTLDVALNERRSLVRIRAMRGVLYAVRRDFVGVVHASSVRQVVKAARAFVRGKGIDAKTYESIAARVEVACRDEALTLREIRQQVAEAVDLGAITTLMAAERRLLLCGPADGRFSRQATYRTFSTALPEVDLDEVSEQEGRMRLLRAYVRGYGPVSRRDAAWWTGMDLKRVQRAVEALDEEIIEVTIRGDDTPLLMHVADAEELEWAALMASPAVSLLPADDPLLVGYVDRSRFIDDALRSYVFDVVGNAAPVVLSNGRIVAVWDIASPSPTEPKAVTVFPVAPIDKDVADGIESQARRVAALLDAPGPVRYVVGMRPLTARPAGAYLHPLR